MSEIKLTLNPTPAAEPAAEAAAAPEAIQEPVFTPEEQAQIDEFSKQIDVTDTNLVFSYGAHAQQASPNFLTRRWKTSRPRIWTKWAT